MSPTAKATPRIDALQSLHDHIAALSAAMLVAVSSTEVGAVHKLRTSTRRVQAQLALLNLVHTDGEPIQPHPLLRRLRRVRRASGVVRDLDVQIGTIRLDAPQKGTVHRGTPGDIIRRQAKALRKSLEAKREAEAKRLVNTLKTQEHQLAVALHEMEEMLAARNWQSVTTHAFVERVHQHFVQHAMNVLGKGVEKGDRLSHRVHSLSDDDLHTLRKLAKLCRYMLESAGRGTAAQKPAQRFEAVQEAGGHWHDWLLLRQLAQSFHGRKAELVRRYATHETAALAEYRLRLIEIVPLLTTAVKATP